MSDSEVPAKDKLSDPSGVNVGVNEVFPEMPGHAREGRNQNVHGLFRQALRSAGMKTEVLSFQGKGYMEELTTSSSGAVCSQP